MKRLSLLVLLLWASLGYAITQTTYVFSTNSRLSLPIVIDVNGSLYKLSNTTEFPKPGSPSCITVNVSGSMKWSATDCDGDRMNKYDRNPVHNDDGSIRYISIRLHGVTKQAKTSVSKAPASSTRRVQSRNSSSSGNQSFKEHLAGNAASLFGDVLSAAINKPSYSEYIMQEAANGDEFCLSIYANASFWGGQNVWYYKDNPKDIPMNDRNCLDALLRLNDGGGRETHKHDAEIGFMIGRGMGMDADGELARSFLADAREYGQRKVANLAEAEILLCTERKDTLQALDLLSEALGTTTENILSGYLPDKDSLYAFSGFSVGDYIKINAYIDLGRILWSGCSAFVPQKNLAIEMFRRIYQKNQYNVYLCGELASSIMQLTEEENDTPDLDVQALDLAVEALEGSSTNWYNKKNYKFHTAWANYLLGFLYKDYLKDYKKAVACMKQACKHPSCEQDAKKTLDEWKKEAKSKPE